MLRVPEDASWGSERAAEERMEVCRYLKLEGAQKDTTIFKQGDPGDKFYLILCGSVGLFAYAFVSYSSNDT